MIQKPKGTQDIYGNKGYIFKYLNNYIDDFIHLYNYEYIKLPTFEHSELFIRGVGDTTDIVSKEMYNFKDKSNRDITLIPEGTAGTARMLLENKLYSDGLINKFYYNINCFRYERPQSGRYREFSQFGVEVFGSDNPMIDVEVISLAYRFFNSLGIDNLKVKINSIGDTESRKMHKEALLKYLDNKVSKLCSNCQERYKKNPLRILDCKDDSESEIVKNAPKSLDYLNEKSKDFFNNLIKGLKDLNLPCEIDKNLVRGLDYYSDTVFEIVSEDKNLSAAATICGGGRYNSLTEIIGGPKIPAIGFAVGLDRLAILLENKESQIKEPKLDIFIMNLYKGNDAYILCDELRNNGFSVEIDYLNRNLKSQFKLVDRFNPSYILIIGEDEVKGNFITVKDNTTKESIQINKEEIFDYLNINF